jgi:hypothetical protein
VQIDAGAGSFWMQRMAAGPDFTVTMSVQRCFPSHVESFVGITSGYPGMPLDSPLAALRTTDPVSAITAGPYPSGVWARLPGALKRPVVALWYRRIFPETARLRLSLPALGIDQQFELPDALPGETLIGDVATSGLLRLDDTVSVLRLSLPGSVDREMRPPFPVALPAEEVVGTHYLNGSHDAIDAIITIKGAPGQVAVTISD